MFWFFGHKACGNLAALPGIEPAPPALAGGVLATGLPGRSPLMFLILPYADSQLQPFPKLHVHVKLPVRRLSFDCL